MACLSVCCAGGNGQAWSEDSALRDAWEYSRRLYSLQQEPAKTPLQLLQADGTAADETAVLLARAVEEDGLSASTFTRYREVGEEALT